ncbi:MAG: RNA methyltransferase [Clostridia bacterium]|nr:RNA methyltransferase [Clostridia bacterium]
MKEISSVGNPTIKELTKLNKSSKLRNQKRCFLVEGVRLIDEVQKSKLEIEALYVTKNFIEKNKNFISNFDKNKLTLISENVAKKISDVETNQGIFATVKMRENSQIKISKSQILILYGLQNPSNIGTILRSSIALGIDHVILCDCCDLYNSKLIRAAMGASFKRNIYQINDIISLLRVLKEKGFKIYGTFVDSDAKDITTVDFSSPCVCIIGNEGNGIDDTVGQFTEKITIKMRNDSESLNAAAAANIVIWEMTRQSK